ncbi:MAG: hypothetical protein WBR15_03925 [Gammaproteobacteria bacterium]
MDTVSYATVLELLSNGDADIGAVGVFWGQAARVRLPEVTEAVLSVPTTLHLEGEMDGIVYAQLLAGPGLKQAWRCADLTLAWSRHRPRRGRERAAVNSFAIPDLALYWQAEHVEPEAQQLGVEFATVLAEEFPDPMAELLRYFSTDLATLANQLAEADYLQAGTTLASNKEKRQ